MTALPPGLVWLASYPKSGNTWVRALLSNLISAAARPENINHLTVRGIAADRDQFEDRVLVRADHLAADAVDALRPAVHQAMAASLRRRGRVVKTHDAYGRLADGRAVMAGAVRALYVVRDPRDVAVSLAHHYGLAMDAAIDSMADPGWRMAPTARHLGYALGDWGNHVAGWLDQTDMPVLLVRYEDLAGDTVAGLGRIAAFLGLAVDTPALVRAVAHAAFAELSRQEQENGFVERPDAMMRFFRQGRAGAWRDHLGPAQAARLCAACAPVMARLGYDAPETSDAG